MINDEENADEILQIKTYFIKNRIKCFKYNYALEDSVQNFTSFQGYFQLTEDGEEFKITNLKPVEKLQYMLEEDSNLVEQERLRQLNLKRNDENQVDKDYMPSELDESLDMIEFKEDRSGATFKLSQI